MGEKIVVMGASVDDGAGVVVTLEISVDIDVKKVGVEVSDGVSVLMVGDIELKGKDEVDVDVAREGILIELEGKINVVSCDVGTGVAVGVAEKGSNDMVSPEPKSPEPSGSIEVMETIGVLLLTTLLGDIGTVETIGVLLLTTLL